MCSVTKPTTLMRVPDEEPLPMTNPFMIPKEFSEDRKRKLEELYKTKARQEFFAIRHKPTGWFLPQRSDMKGGGHTKDEPTPFQPPRLFTRKQDAQCALKWWLKGETNVKMGRHYDSWSGGYEYDEDWNTVKVPYRKEEEMEVVKVIIRGWY